MLRFLKIIPLNFLFGYVETTDFSPRISAKLINQKDYTTVSFSAIAEKSPQRGE
jgi:hypothetical protein